MRIKVFENGLVYKGETALEGVDLKGIDSDIWAFEIDDTKESGMLETKSDIPNIQLTSINQLNDLLKGITLDQIIINFDEKQKTLNE